MDQTTTARALYLLTGLGFLVVGAQVTLFHYRGNFRNPAMWLPVISAPLLGLILLYHWATTPVWLLAPLRWFLWLEFLGGLIGFGYHVRGITQRLGGFKLNNLLTGPPILLPLLLSFLSILGLVALAAGGGAV
ncbi:MAG TPA: hypothetical protein VK191_12190 [Symbiobacteriaceae bacterium]|nr:hypothetical protein [Symbiobacteriaceae bacterium]